MHMQELQRLGADIQIDGHTAIVRSVAKLSGAPDHGHRLARLALLVLAGLVADAATTVDRIYYIDRGCENSR